MPARDTYHQQARRALVKDGWRITHDPLSLRYKGAAVFIDLGAEKRLPEAQGERLVAIEIKLLSDPLMSEFEKAVGQYQLYRFMLRRKGLAHELFLALPQETYDSLRQLPALLEFLAEAQISLLVFDVAGEEILQWIK
jgi:hypothetical protein